MVEPMSYAADFLSPLPGHQKWLPAPATGPLAVPQEPGTRERGASNIIMTALGQHQMRVRGQGFGQQIRANAMAHGHMPRVQIHTSLWDRTRDSADQLHQQLAQLGVPAGINIIPELAPQSLGELEGQPDDKVENELDRYRTQLRDIPLPGISPLTGQKGESTDHYAGRVVPVVDKLVQDSAEHPSTIHIVAAHSSDMREVRRKYDPGFSGKDHIEPARTDLIHVANDGQARYVPDVTIGGNRKLVPGVYLQHHGATEFSTARPEMPAEAALKSLIPRRESDNPTNPSMGGNSSGSPPPTGQY